MNVRRLYLDANVLITLGEGKGETADLLSDLVRQKHSADDLFLCTSELTLAELLVHPYRHDDERLVSQYQNWLISGSFMTVGPVDRSVILSAAMLRAEHTGLKLPDAIHLSTAVLFECSHFLSADSRLPPHIDLSHKRFEVTKGNLRLDVVQPEPITLRNIIQSKKIQ